MIKFASLSSARKVESSCRLGLGQSILTFCQLTVPVRERDYAKRETSFVLLANAQEREVGKRQGETFRN